ncbi:4-oxalocrotonate tautomerase [Clostridium botulinum]|nr:4-oxalocrotonate tautomerase [Clostridium botulinum]
MPVISLQMGKLTKEQKREIIEKITANIAQITKIPEAAVTVLIHELDDENIGTGGKDLGVIKKIL